jgi:hypothetical protein
MLIFNELNVSYISYLNTVKTYCVIFVPVDYNLEKYK